MAKGLRLQKFPLDPKSFYEIYKDKKNFTFEFVNYKKIFDKFKNIQENIYKILDKEITKLSEVNRYIIYSDIHIINYLLHHIYYQLFQKNLKKMNIEILYETNGDVSKILNINEEYFQLIKKKKSIKIEIKNYVKDLIVNSRNIFSYKKKYLSLGSLSFSKKQYARENKILLINKSNEFLNNKNFEKINLDDELKKFISFYLNEINNFLIKDYHIEIDQTKFKKIFIKRYLFLFRSFLSIKNKSEVFDGVIIDNVMQPVNRICAAYFKYIKKDAITLDHGLHNHTISRPIELLIPLVANKHICINSLAQKKLSNYSYNNKGYFYKDRKELKFEHLRGELYKSKIRNFKKFYRNPKKKLNVLVAGYPHNHWLYPELPRYSFYEKLFSEINIGKYLKKFGANSFYKIHPDRNNSFIKDIIKKNYDFIIEENFEKLNLNNYDLVIQTYTLGRTFMYSVLQNIPIIFLDGEINDQYNDEYDKKKLNERCMMINYLGQNNYLEFNYSELENYLNKIKNNSNTYSLEYSKINTN